MSHGSTKFQQVLRVEDYRIESGAEAEPGARDTVAPRSFVRIWLIGSPGIEHSTVTNAFLEASSDWGERLPLPRFDFHRKRIVIAYEMTAIQPVVSMLLDGIQVYCQFRELVSGGVYADVHRPQSPRPGMTLQDLHWVGSD